MSRYVGMRWFDIARLAVVWGWRWRSVPVWAWLFAATACKEGRYGAAERYYKSGLEGEGARHPAAQFAMLDLARCLFKQERVVEAETILKNLVDQHPRVREGYIQLARIQNWMGRPVEAALTIRRALKLANNDKDLASRYLMYVAIGDAPEYMVADGVKEAYHLMLHKTHDTKYHFASALLDLRFSPNKSARTRFIKFTRASRSLVHGVVRHARLLLDEGEIAAARLEIRRVLTNDPNYPPALALMAKSYLTSGPHNNPHYANQLAERCCQLVGWSTPDFLCLLAESCIAIGDRETSRVILELARSKAREYKADLLNRQKVEQLVAELTH